MNEQVQRRSREELLHLQLERLQMTLNRAYFNVDFYRRRMDALNLLPEEVGTFETFQKFPFTTRQDLWEHYPYGLFAEPLKSIVRLKTAQPALRDQGKPIVVGFTRRDVTLWQGLMVNVLQRLGVTERDIVQVAFNYNLFPGAFTFNHAAEILGATLAPSATISATLQLQIMQDFRCTVLATTAAFALHMVETLEAQGMSTSSLNLKRILLGPDPLSDITRSRLESGFGVPVYGLYGVSDMVEPGMAGECNARDGLHVAEDHFLLELVHPVSGDPVPPGQEGELIVTTLTAEAYPLLRYRTGDITVLRTAPCSCGLASSRIVPILRRTDSRVSIRGVHLYPEDLEKLIKSYDRELGDVRFIIRSSHGIGQQLEILLTRPEDREYPGGSRGQYIEGLRGKIRRALGLGVRLQLVEPDRLPREGLIYKTVFKNADGEDPHF